MPYFGFEYFCGANVLVRVGDMPILEATGISVGLQESKRPIYGYSSRFFDAVASGQVLVQGQLIINYVHQDYLYHAIASGLGLESTDTGADSGPEVEEIEDYMSVMGENPGLDDKYVQALRAKFWSSPGSSAGSMLNPTRSAHDNLSGINLKVTFGDQDLDLNNSGKTGMLISNVYFLGRSSVINISEDVVLEAYPFIARDIHSLRAGVSEAWISQSTLDPSFQDNQTITFTGNRN